MESAFYFWEEQTCLVASISPQQQSDVAIPTWSTTPTSDVMYLVNMSTSSSVKQNRVKVILSWKKILHSQRDVTC